MTSTPLNRDAMEAFWLPFTPNRQFQDAPKRSSPPKAWTTSRRTAGTCPTAWPGCGASTPAMASRASSR